MIANETTLQFAAMTFTKAIRQAPGRRANRFCKE
jgi:hypothetical protein